MPPSTSQKISHPRASGKNFQWKSNAFVVSTIRLLEKYHANDFQKLFLESLAEAKMFTKGGGEREEKVGRGF